MRYESLVADPLAEVERLYARVGLQLRDEARHRMTRWLRRHHDRRVSGHRYSLGDFPLDQVEVGQRFARYLEWADAHTGGASRPGRDAPGPGGPADYSARYWSC